MSPNLQSKTKFLWLVLKGRPFSFSLSSTVGIKLPDSLSHILPTERVSPPLAGEMNQGSLTILRESATTIKHSVAIATIFLPKQGAPSPFDQVEVRIYLISAIHSNIQAAYFIEISECNPLGDSLSLGFFGCRDGLYIQTLPHSFPQGLYEKSGCGSASQTQQPYRPRCIQHSSGQPVFSQLHNQT